MAKATLPILKQEIVGTQLIRTESEIEVDVDASLAMEYRWEKNFPELAKRESLTSYIERINNQDEASKKASYMSALKAVYCVFESDSLPTFESFLKLFNLSDQEYLDKLQKQIDLILKLVLGGSVVSEKN